MTSSGNPASLRKGGRPRDLTGRTRIMEAAWRLFVTAGVEATRMEAVAAAARVSKSTLYAAFPDRSALFEAAMLHAMLKIEADQQVGDPGPDSRSVRDRLNLFGIGIMAFLASEVGVAFYGTLSAEIRRRPDLSAIFWDFGPGRTRANLTALIAAAAGRGEIAVADAAQAADLLFGLWQGFSNLELAIAGGAETVRAGMADRVTRGTDLFLTLYAA
ncbi:TetR/AcrR family transcriptional regulator [Sphingomonas sp.]|uniref:TetR/AcrR family transcriptional regulator n=1 Tax=Sphingomonas sp. TaxID=28214 RepID=UPI003CC68593